MTRSITSPKTAAHKLRRILLSAAFWLLIWQFAAMWVGRSAILPAWSGDPATLLDAIAAAWRDDPAALLDAVFRGQELLLPGPIAVAVRLGELAVTAAFWQTAATSLVRIFAGFLCGAAAGGLLAVLTSAFRWADTLFSPAVRVIRATPVASFILLIILWVTTSLVPGVCAALMVMPVVWGNVSKGIAQTDPLLLEAARAYRFGRVKTGRLVYLPSALPYFASGCATGLGLAWKAGVAAEVLCLPALAIGTEILNAKRYLETPSLFAWTAVVILLSFLLENVLSVLFRRMERGWRW